MNDDTSNKNEKPSTDVEVQETIKPQKPKRGQRSTAGKKKSRSRTRATAGEALRSGIDSLSGRINNDLVHKLIHVAYGLIAVSLVFETMLPAVLGIVITHLCEKGRSEEWLSKHRFWLWRTYWLGFVVALPCLFIGYLVDATIVWTLLYLVFIPLYVWVGLRCVRGWLYLYQKESIPRQDSWFW